jgi:membrane fusion protein, multidrug efflux system
MDTATLQPHNGESETNGQHTDDVLRNPPRRIRTRTILLIAVIVLAVLAVFLISGMVYRSQQNHSLAASTSLAVSTPPVVYVIHPVVAGASGLTLPGTTQAIQDAIVYARVSGYLAKRNVDLGDHVKAGQDLAEIESPELDQELIQAKANLKQALKQLDLQRADLELARTTMVRYQAAVKDSSVAQELVDQAVAAYAAAQASVAAAQATVAANQATVGQFQAMTDFEHVLAPFDGIITQRNVDVGALITAGSPTNNTSVAPTSVSGAATGLFEVSQIDTLRVFVNIPQVMAPSVAIGTKAQVTARGALNSPVSASVARTANALDPGSRTLLTEVDVPNSSHHMLPGAFVNVSFNLKPSGEHLNIPATALIFNAQGTQVMRVDAQNKLHLLKVTVGRDFGDTVDIQAGLNPDDTILEQPDVSLQESETVTPTAPPHHN